MKITIPASIEEVTEQLNGIHLLLTATEWEKAAIVAAFVHITPNGKITAADRLAMGSHIQTSAEFRARGINGLKDVNTVRHYVNAWESTGLPKPVIGEDVELPTIDFPVSTPNVKDVISGADPLDRDAIADIAVATREKLIEASEAESISLTPEQREAGKQMHDEVDAVLQEVGDALITFVGPVEVLSAWQTAARDLTSVMEQFGEQELGLIRRDLVTAMNAVARLINLYGPAVNGNNDWDSELEKLLSDGGAK